MLKPVIWLGTTLRDLRSFPEPVRLDIGYALFAAQRSEIDPRAKPLKGFGGASVIEIVASHHGNAWSAVYTVRFRHAIYAYYTPFRRSRLRALPLPQESSNG